MRPIDADTLKNTFCSHCSRPIVYNESIEDCRSRSCSTMDVIDDTPTIDTILAMPCKIGDMVYQIYKETVWSDEYRMSYHYELCVRKVPFRIEMINAIGKTVFLTNEEAEAVLKKQKHE